MVKHTRTTADELFVFNNFAGLVLKGLKRLLTQFSLSNIHRVGKGKLSED